MKLIGILEIAHKDLKQSIISLQRNIKKKLLIVGNPVLMKEEFSKLDMWEREQFFDFWMENFEVVGVRRG